MRLSFVGNSDETSQDCDLVIQIQFHQKASDTNESKSGGSEDCLYLYVNERGEEIPPPESEGNLSNDEMELSDEPSDSEYTHNDDTDESWRDSDGMSDGSGNYVNRVSIIECIDCDQEDESFPDTDDMSHGSELMDAFSDLSEDNCPLPLDFESTYTSSSEREEEGVEEEEEYEVDEPEEDSEREDMSQDDEYFDEPEGISEEDESNISRTRSSSHSDDTSRSHSPLSARVNPVASPPQPPSSVNPSLVAQPTATPIADAPCVQPSVSDSTYNNSDDKGDGTCCICLDDSSTHVVVPCGHICLCQKCSELLTNNERKKQKCPLCKTKFSLIIKVYK